MGTVTPVDEHQERKQEPDLELVEGKESSMLCVRKIDERTKILKVKLQRAQGECLGAWSRRRT